MALTPRAKLFFVANSLLGVEEKPGPESNKVVLSWIHQFFQQAKDDSLTAWCGIAIAIFCRLCSLARYIPAHPYRAQAWKDVGRSIPIEEAEKGDLVVMWRVSKTSGLGHVTLFSSLHPDGKQNMFEGLGGNQKNKIKYSNYSLNRVLDVRRLD